MEKPAKKHKISKRPGWDEYFMFLAKVAASRSTCLSRPVGAILVLDRQILATGYNGSMPDDKHCLDEDQCFKRSLGKKKQGKYDYCRASHAEANLLAQAAKKGISVEGATLYVTLMPCYTCTKQLAVAGIKDVVYEHIYESEDPQRDKYWREAIESRLGFRQLSIERNTINYIVNNFINDITSRRRLTTE
ncbi:MAG: dCMP deaminase family protein [Candidatus Eremiobacteraeota bacterium]|nr:dCMP deaminase family protein [Candidatus Eremiobacteraeota bacterium]